MASGPDAFCETAPDGGSVGQLDRDGSTGYHSLRGAITALMIVLICGCGTEPQRPAVMMYDSAGVRVVAVDADLVGAVIAVEEQPELIVGDGVGRSGLVLHGVADVLLLEDGVLLIAEQSTQQVVQVRLASDGVRRHGGRGDGPLEFRGLSSLHDLGEGRFGAWDSRRQRLVQLDTAGTGSETPTRASLHGVSSARLHMTGTPIAFLLTSAPMPNTPTNGPVRENGYLLRTDGPLGDGVRVDTVSVLPGASMFVTPELVGGVLFGPLSLTASALDGVWHGDTERQEVVQRAVSADVVSLVRWTRSRSRSLTEARKAEFWERLTEAASDEETAAIPELRKKMLFADSIPAFGSLVVSMSGDVWIGDYGGPEYQLLDLPEPATNWLVVRPETGAAARAATPRGFRPLRIGVDYLLGVHVDDLGRQTVRLHRYGRVDDPMPLASGPWVRASGPSADRDNLAGSLSGARSPNACYPPGPLVAGGLVRGIPKAHTVEAAAAVDDPARVRSFDGAPSSYVAAWISNASGERMGEPALWVIEGGAGREHDRRAKSYYPLNDAAAALTAARIESDGERRRPITDARALRVPYREDHPSALAALHCLMGSGGRP